MEDLFFREVFRLDGLPKYIVNDQNSRFFSAFWQELFRLVGTEFTPSTNYHPYTDGQIDIVNKWVEGYLSNYVSRQQRAWIKWLHLGEHCYKTTYRMSIGMTPFQKLYGYDAPSFVDLAFGDSRAPKAKYWIQENQDIFRVVKEKLQVPHNRQEIYGD
jgi:hypothetical protein